MTTRTQWVKTVERDEGIPLATIIRREREFGVKQKDIALSLGVTHAQLVYVMRNNLGIPKIEPVPFSVVEQVRAEYSGRGSCKALARKYKQPIGTIRNWIAGRSRVSK